jgi:hypothetical protein
MALYHIIAALTPKRGFATPTDDAAGRLTVELDALVSEDPEYTAEATKYSVERGAVISDHVALNPLLLNVEAVVTNTPASLVKILSGATFRDPAGEALKVLKRLWQERVPFSFVGGLETYTNMVIISLQAPRRAGTANALVFSCRMQQLNIVESREVSLEKIRPADLEKAAPAQDVGFQPSGTFQNVTTTEKVLANDLSVFNAGGGSYPLPSVPSGIGAPLSPGVIP